jgi:hypothetical protein
MYEHDQSQCSDNLYIPAYFYRAERRAESLPMNMDQEQGNSGHRMILCKNTKEIIEKTHFQFVCNQLIK